MVGSTAYVSSLSYAAPHMLPETQTELEKSLLIRTGPPG